jgi:hypothetical protein
LEISRQEAKLQQIKDVKRNNNTTKTTAVIFFKTEKLFYSYKWFKEWNMHGMSGAVLQSTRRSPQQQAQQCDEDMASEECKKSH